MFGIILWYIIPILSQFHGVYMLCENRNTCLECISDPSVCAWCAANDFNGTTRCTPADSIPHEWCPEPLRNVKNPEIIVKSSENHNFSSRINNYVQIKPQSFNIKLRPGLAANFDFTFKGSENYPVDLYFLIDASKTMYKYKELAANQSEQIYSTFKKMTENVFMGFGTFIDKNVLPFVHELNSTATYSFRHHLKLSDDQEKFKNVVSNVGYGTNRDPPEGGLDALAQVMACNETIGWRNGSTKIIIFLTDAPCHFAGDGKAAGIFEPYDGNCHTVNNEYTKEKDMDYPSLGRINQMAIQKNVIILFAIAKTAMFESYTKISKAITGSKAVNIDKGTGISTMLKEMYEDITKTIKLKVSFDAGLQKKFDLSVSPDCLTLKSNDSCESKPAQEQTFKVTLRLKESIPIKNTKVNISVDGISEQLVLNISFFKECECTDEEKSSPYCSFKGTRLCGICECDSNRVGAKCECAKDENNPTFDDSACRNPDTNLTCSDNGVCICGRCECHKGFECKYCQIASKECNGHGHSECGVCICDDDYSGENCECYKATDRCIAPDQDIECYKHGHCECNKCECANAEKWDKRPNVVDKYCIPLPCNGCEEGQCAALEACVLCKLEKEDCPKDVCYPSMTVHLVDTLSVENSTSLTKCSNVRVSAGCSTLFGYWYNPKSYGISVMVQKNVNCAENYLWYGGAVLLALLLGGIGALIGWKVVTDRRDRREFQDFLVKNKADLSEINENPLFIEPQTHVKNPGFRKRSFR